MLGRGVFPTILALALLWSACGSSDNGTGGDGTSGPVLETYDEGTVRMEIEYLDTGLLKGHAYAEASDGWRVASIAVSATDSDGDGWIVIEPPGDQVGFGTASASEFFEVRLEELPRGEQITVVENVTFENVTGAVERTAEDRWPP
jgi:hypothetical protein